MLLRAAAKENGWNLNYGGIALMWRGGCIIRSRFLGKIKEAFDKNPQLHEPAARQLLLRARSTATRTSGARRWSMAIEVRRSHAGLLHGAGVLRRLSHGASAGQPAAGAARLLRRAHLRARRPAARPVLPHQLDRRGGGRVSSGTYNVVERKHVDLHEQRTEHPNPNGALDFLSLGALSTVWTPASSRSARPRMPDSRQRRRVQRRRQPRRLLSA